MDKSEKIFVAGHRGLVGSALIRRFEAEGFGNLVKRARSQLDLADEEAVRKFVCIYSGKQWEEFYEALFGYEAKREARERWGHDEHGKMRPRFAAWRDR